MHDIIIIGAGPAALTAATYLGRFRRPTMVLDGGASRARWIPTSHNLPGFPAGISGAELLAHLRVQAGRYGAQIRPGEVESILRVVDGFELDLGTERLRTRYLLLATGVRDRLPPLEGVAEAILRSVVRVCPICDAFEAIGKKIAVISDNDKGEREAEFLTTYSNRVTLIAMADVGAASRQRLEAAGISVVTASWSALEVRGDALHVHSPSGPMTFDVAYAALGCTPQDDLAAKLGAARDPSNALTVDEHQQTSVPSLYAAGDVVRGLNQIAVAAAEGAIAATDIHNRLRKE
ncbi:MAG TPA: NAD(P)/FAD-dependent oxidoreductase [Steroidobacteraceae bacterium]|jgi:thioredoxin reductase (NADPH)|nr:NAD(P)/FAD-dependent oxidoreductase [Steroidobacteraceae bacterium]